MRIIAILDKSAGNETVGESWQETAIFDGSDAISLVMEWAAMQHEVVRPERAQEFRGRLQLTIAQEPTRCPART